MKAKIAKSAHKHVFSKIYLDSFHILEAAEIITNEFMNYLYLVKQVLIIQPKTRIK